MVFRNHLFQGLPQLMNRALDTYTLRQRTTATNIANVNSPHYRPQNVKFEEYFYGQEMVLKGHQSDNHHIPLGMKDVEDISGERADRDIPEPEIYFSGETHVNIDKEMSEMAQNQIRFRFASRMMNRYFTGITQSITGNVTR